MLQSAFFNLFLRHALTLLSGFLVAKGLLPGGTEADFAGAIVTFLAGGVLSAQAKETIMGVVMGFIRHVLTFAAGFLVSQGWLTPELSVQLVAGIMSMLSGLGLSVLDKKGVGPS